MPGMDKPGVRSGFVSTLAWTSIAFAAFGTLIAILQNVMFATMMPAEDMQAVLREIEQDPALPEISKFLFANMRLMLVLFLALCVVTLVASIGLLLRRNWARLAFIVLMVLGAVSNVVGAIAPFFMLSAMGDMAKAMPAEMQGSMGLVMNATAAFMALVALIFAALFAWVAKRLMAREVKSEFA